MGHSAARIDGPGYAHYLEWSILVSKMNATSDSRADDEPPAAAQQATTGSAHQRARRGPRRLIWRTVVKSWTDGILGMSAQAAFWMTLSLPPLLLGLLGSLGFVSRWFGPNTIESVQGQILQVAANVFTDEVVDQIIRPTVTDILTQGRSSIVSVGFLLSLMAGSSALASLVDSITPPTGRTPFGTRYGSASSARCSTWCF